MSSADPDRSLGEYRLIRQLVESGRATRWLAEQVSISRRVLIDELKPEQSAHREQFLADIRAKAAVEHPLVGSVYEAVADAGHCFCALELLPGATLDDRRQAGEPLKPAVLAQILHLVADAQIQQETAGIAALPAGAEHIHLDEHGVIRLENLAVGGPRPPDQSTRDIAHLGSALVPLVSDGQPGTTRTLTLLGWMRGEHIREPLSWQQVRQFAIQIEQQLAPPVLPAPTQSVAKRDNRAPLVLAAGLGALVVVGLLLFALKGKNTRPVPPLRVPVIESILIPAGSYPTPDGTDEDLPAFRIATHEVTIGEYAAFLETLETLAQNQRERTFDHESQPPEKTSHLPDDWPALLAAARANGTWNGRNVSLDSPVVGIDWWDCAAYAEWRKARIATQEEWFAALRSELADPSVLPAGAWLPVTSPTADRTARGILGMAGSVAEWTRRPAPNPANPLGERKWVIIGGSFLKPGSNALTREWVDDRSLRRPDLGFRLVFDVN